MHPHKVVIDQGCLTPGGGGVKKYHYRIFCAHVRTIITALIKQISLLDTANSHDKYLKFQFKVLNKYFVYQYGGQNGDIV